LQNGLIFQILVTFW